MLDTLYTPSFKIERAVFTNVFEKLSKKKINIEKQIKKKRENFCLAPLWRRAERIAIPKSSLLVNIYKFIAN